MNFPWRSRLLAPGAVLGAAALAALAATMWGVASYMDEAPDPFAFAPVRQSLPGALVRSENVQVFGFRGPLAVRVGGASGELWINGKPAHPPAMIKPGDRIAVAVRASAFYDDTVIGTVRVGNRTAEFQVTSLRRPPPDSLTFQTVRVAPGRWAISNAVAPHGWPAGATLTVAGAHAEVETSRGRFVLPATLTPGEMFRLVTRVPEDQTAPLEIQVSLAEMRGVWRIDLP